MSGRAGRMFRPVLDLLYPPFCVSCEALLPFALGSGKPPLCPDCAQKWAVEKRTLCPICGRAHTDCACGVPGLGGSVAEFLHLARYTDWESVARNMVLRAKDEAYGSLYGFITSELAELLQRRQIPVEGAVFTYIPRSRKKIRDRGVDQGRKTAEMLAKYFDVPCIATLKRDDQAAEQKGLTAPERHENAAKAFYGRKDALSKVKGKPVILYDDVITSGASVSRAVELLRSEGAGKIYVLTFAKTVYKAKSGKSAPKSPDSPDFEDDFSDFTLEDDG